MKYLDSLVPSSLPTLARLMVERDGLPPLLMWETSMRGKNCGEVTLSDFSQMGREWAEPQAAPAQSLANEQLVDPQAQWDKDCQRAQARAFCADR